MKTKYISFLVAAFCFSRMSLAAGHMHVFSCKTAEQKWQAQLEFTETDGPKIYLSDGQVRTVCTLRFEEFSISPKSEVPNLQAKMTPFACNSFPNLTKEMLGELYLRVTKDLGKYQGRLQWLRHSQPGACVVSQFDSEGVKRLQTRWREGNLN